MNKDTIKVGLDVHKETIVTAVLPPQSEKVTERGQIRNNPNAVEALVKRIAAKGPVEFVYEAGPCGYGVQRQITKMGHSCAVIAPSLTPVRPGDRVKTDKRDAEKLARLFRAGELTEIRIPTREEEAARDLTRVREDVLKERLQARHRLSKFLLRQGRVYRDAQAWGTKHKRWLQSQRFDWDVSQKTFEAYMRSVQEADDRLETLNQQVSDLAQHDSYKIPVQYLRCLKGVDTLSALTMVVETQEFRRFAKAPKFMGMTGLVISEDSSGESIRKGHITKTGNAHLRRVLVEAAWSYRYGPIISEALAKRREGCPPEVVRIAKKAQIRLHRRFWRLVNRNKLATKAVVAVARELAGFVWAISHHFPVKKTCF